VNESQLLNRLAAANAYPANADAPEQIWTHDLALHELDRRIGMQSSGTTRLETETTPPRRRKGVLVAAAAFVAVLIFGVVLALTSGGDETTPPATSETTPPITEAAPNTTAAPTTTTVAPTTTVALSTTAVPAVLAAIDARNRGDSEAYLESLAGDELAVAQGTPDELSVIMGYANQTTELIDCQVTGIHTLGWTIVECGVILRDDFFGAGGIVVSGTATSYVTDNDKINTFSTFWDEADLPWEETQLAMFNFAFFTWLMEAHPTVFEAIGPIPEELGSIPGVDNTIMGDPHEPEEMLIALEYVAEFVAQSDLYPLNP
jgi:hypothetical protein